MAAERWERWGAAGLAALVLALYAPVLGFELVDLDDDTILPLNPHLAQGLTPRALWWALTGFYGGWWYPVTWLTHLVSVELFGAWAGGHHAVNALFHAANALLAVAVLRRFGLGPGQALAAAALAMLHPTRVESVAWVTERKDLVFVFFGLLALLAWARWQERPTPARYALALAAYAASLMGKSMLVTLPLLLLLLDAWTAKGVKIDWRAKVVEKLPLFALAAGSAVLTLLAARAADGLQPLSALPVSQRLAALPVALVQLLGLTFAPVELAAYYPRRTLGVADWAPALAACLAVVAALVALRKKAPHLGFGAGWLAISILPVSGLAQAGGQLTADRYLHWPHLGLFAALVLSVPRPLAARPAARLALLAVLATLAALTAFRLPVWRNSETLFQETLAAQPDSSFIQTSWGLWLLKHGRPAEAVAPLAKAAPGYPYAQSILGLALLESGNPESGRRELLQALERSPRDAGLQRNVALGLSRLSALALAAGNLAQARADAERALTLSPGLPEAEAARTAANRP